MPRRALIAGFLLGLFLTAPSSEAGIVILETGDVLVGRVDPQLGPDGRLRIRWPYGDSLEQGEMWIELHRVRWYDPEADLPDAAYWDAHLHDPLKGPRWVRLQQEEMIRRRPGPEVEVEVPDGSELLRGPLDLVPVEGVGFSLRKPVGWDVRVEEDILIVEAPPGLGNGFRPRIHLFAAPAARAAPADQIDWIREELAGLSADARFGIVELSRARPTAGGADQRLLTETTLAKRSVLALRQVSFRRDQTTFFAAYADAEDYEGLRRVFQACLKSLRIHSDA